MGYCLWDKQRIAACMASLLAAELGRLRGRNYQWQALDWNRDLYLDEAGLGTDSAELVSLAQAVNRFFRLHVSGIEDYLLRQRQLGAWIDIVQEGLAQGDGCLTFTTSGTSGAVKEVTHTLACLTHEARIHGQLLPPLAKIAAFVPAHHIYGFIWTVLLPWQLQVPVYRGCSLPAGDTALKPGTLVVTVPQHWQQLQEYIASWPQDVCGVSSAGPLAAATARWLRQQAVAALWEVYGATETAGIGCRGSDQEPFKLLDCWQRYSAHQLWRRSPAGHEGVVALPDEVRWQDDKHLWPSRRLDRQVQVWGQNVSPQQVAACLQQHGAVVEAAVRLDVDQGRLRAFVVPAPGWQDDVSALEQELASYCRQQLLPAQRPWRFDVGSELPRNSMGKLAHW